MKYLRMDLKVCEGCGALWLRKDASCGLYCQSCAKRLAEFPAPRGRHAGGRPRLASTSNSSKTCRSRRRGRHTETPTQQIQTQSAGGAR